MKKEELFYIYNKVDGRIFRVGMSDYGAWSDLVCMTPGAPLSFAEMYEHDMECFKPLFMGFYEDHVPTRVVMEAAAAVMRNPGLDDVRSDLERFYHDFCGVLSVRKDETIRLTATIIENEADNWTLEIKDDSQSYGWLFREDCFADCHSCRTWAHAYYDTLLDIGIDVKLEFKKKCKDNGRTE